MATTDNLIFDVSGLLYRTYYGAVATSSRPKHLLMLDDEDEDHMSKSEEIAGYALHTAMSSMQKYFNLFKPSRVIACFDRPGNWRAAYTASDLSVSRVPYKGHRRQNQTEQQKIDHKNFMLHVQEFEQVLHEQTGIVVLAGKGLEADDCIAGFVQTHADQQNVIVTGDSDMFQLITENTKVWSLGADQWAECPDPKYYLFEKIFRGDRSSDNIPSAYPRLRADKIKKAYVDTYTLNNLLNEPYVTDYGVTVLVSDMWHENQLLIDLTKQPELIRDRMHKLCTDQLQKSKRFDYWGFMRFCKTRKLNKIMENMLSFRPLLIGGYEHVRS